MKTDITNTDLIRRYLLDGLTDDERSAVEERFFADDNAFDEILAVEDELFYEYQQNELSAGERQVFEQKFLRTREDRDRAAFAAAFVDASADLSRERAFAAVPEAEEKTSFLRSIAAFFNFGSALQFGMAAAGLLLAVGIIGLLTQKSRINNELAAAQQQNEIERRDREAELLEKQRQQKEIEDQLAAERDKAVNSENRVKELEVERQKLGDEINQRRDRPDSTPLTARPGSTIATMIISPGLFTRSDGIPMNRAVLTTGKTTLSLRLRLKNVDEYQKFGIVVRSVDGDNVILSRSNLSPSGRGSRRGLTLNIPASSLKRADYEISLTGLSKIGETEDITTYYFSVDKR